MRAASTFFAGLAEQQPLVLVLSDLHWGDDVVLDFLPRLLTHLAALPVVVVGTTRPELTDRWSPPAGRHNTVHVNLDPLAADDTAALLQNLLPDADAELVSILRDRSGGNPFFIEELVAMLGEIRRPPRRARAARHPARPARRPARPARPDRSRHARGRVGHRQHRSDRPGARRSRHRRGTDADESLGRLATRTCSSSTTTSTASATSSPATSPTAR